MKAMMRSAAAVFFTMLIVLGAGVKTAAAGAGELPAPARVVLSRAHEHMQNDQYGKALSVIRDFQARGEPDPPPEAHDPRGYHHPEVWFFIGSIHLEKENPDKAAEAFGRALQRDPDHVYARINLARILTEQSDYNGAAGHFLHAYESDGETNPEYLYYAAVTWLMDDTTENTTDSSIDAFTRLVENHPDDMRPEWRENMVHALLSAGREEKALVHIRKLADHYEGDKRIQWQEILLYQYLQMGMEAEAFDYALFLTREAPDNEKWWRGLAHVSLARNNYENALVALTVYGYLTPLSPEEKKLFADLSLHVGIPVLAVPAYEAAMDQKQREQPDRSLLQNLVIAYRQMEKSEKAVEAISAFAGHEEDPDLLVLMADILYNLERFADAAEAYRKAAEKAAGAPAGRAWLMAGYAAWQTEDLPSARKAFEKAAEFERHQPDAEAALKQLRHPE